MRASVDFTDTSELMLDPHQEAWGSEVESLVSCSVKRVWSVSGVPGRGTITELGEWCVFLAVSC